MGNKPARSKGRGGSEAESGASAASASAAPARKHALLDDAEFDQVCAVHAQIASGNVDAGVSACAVAAFMGLPVSCGGALARVLGHANGDAAAAVELSAFADAVGAIVRGSTNEMRDRLLGPDAASEAQLAELFALVFFAADTSAHEATENSNTSDFDAMALVAGVRGFAAAQDEAASDPFTVSRELFRRWCSAQAVSFQEPMHALFLRKLLNGVSATSFAGTCASEGLAALAQSEVLRRADVFALSLADGRAQGAWKMLFSSNRDGLSFDALASGVTGYGGPTLLAVLDAQGHVFGGLVSATWAETPGFFGASDGALVSLRPSFGVMHTRTDGSEPGTANYQFLRARGKTGLQGIGLGGDEFGPRLWIDRNFEECRANDFDLTYERGAVRPRNPDGTGLFKPFIIEAWGLGGVDAEAAQKEELALLDKMRLDRRKVDKKQFADSAFDREFLLGKTFAHQEQAANRGGK